MTIRLLSTYGTAPPQSILTLDPATESTLVAQGNASTDLTGGTVYYADVTANKIVATPRRIGAVALLANQKTSVTVVEGMCLNITNSSDVVGTIQETDINGASIGQAVALVPGSQPQIGPAAGFKYYTVYCAQGTATLAVNDAVLTLADNLVKVGGAVVYAKKATGNPVTDYASLSSAITTAGVGGVVALPYGQTYRVGQTVTLLNKQALVGNGSTIKAQDQVTSTLTATAALTSTTGNSQSVTFQVASTANYFVGQTLALDDRTTAGQKTWSLLAGTVTAIPDATHVSLSFGFSQNVNVYVTNNNTTFLETFGNTYTWPIGANLASIGVVLQTLYGNTKNQITGLEIDGNSASNTLANRWELCPTVKFNADDSVMYNVRVLNTPTDGIYVGGRRLVLDTIWIEKTNSLGFHFGASQGVGNGAQKTQVKNIFIDSPGMGTAQIGHYGGLSSAQAAYAGFGFSTYLDHIVIDGFDIKNTYNGPLAQGIGCIGASTAVKVTFGNGYIDNMTMGAFQINGNSTSVPTDIDMHDLHVTNCAPTVLNQAYDAGVGSDAKYCSFIGSNSFTAGTPAVGRVRLRDSDFLDSPLGICGVSDCKLSNVTFTASAIAKTSSLFFPGPGNITDTVVELNNVTSIRPKGNPVGAPLSNQFNCAIYSEFATLTGNNVKVIGGGQGFSANGGGNNIQITGLRCEDNYSYGVRSRGSAILALSSPVVRLNSGFTADTAWCGIENNSGGGSGGRTTVLNPDVQAVTTNAGQHGINLSPNSAAGTATKVVGGMVKVSGTSTTPIASGGASAVNVVAGVLLSHTFTPGAAEVASNNVVSANI